MECAVRAHEGDKSKRMNDKEEETENVRSKDKRRDTLRCTME